MTIINGAAFTGGDQFFGLVGPQVTKYSTNEKTKVNAETPEAAKTTQKTTYSAKQVLGFIVNLFLFFIPYAIASCFVNKKITLQKESETKESATTLIKGKFAEVVNLENDLARNWQAMQKARDAKDSGALETKSKELFSTLRKLQLEITVKWQETKDSARSTTSNELVDKEFATEIAYVQAILKSPEYLSAVDYENAVRTAQLKPLKDGYAELIAIENKLEGLYGEIRNLKPQTGCLASLKRAQVIKQTAKLIDEKEEVNEKTKPLFTSACKVFGKAIVYNATSAFHKSLISTFSQKNHVWMDAERETFAEESKLTFEAVEKLKGSDKASKSDDDSSSIDSDESLSVGSPEDT